MRYVLDTSALFSMDRPPDGESHVTLGVLKELERYNDSRHHLWGSLVVISEPSKESLEKVRKAAAGTGDIDRLSPVDQEVLALAIDLDAELLTDDYSIQNVAKVMGVRFRTVGTRGIKKVYQWKLRCTGCGREVKEKVTECPVCGSPLTTRRRR